MCTVSFLPTEKGYIITSNRDEAPGRAAEAVAETVVGAMQVYYPKDPRSGGSWFAFADNGDTACLLNGAFEPFDTTITFPFSRGTVLLRSFEYSDPAKFVSAYTFEGTAPFTLVLTRGDALYQLVWDGEREHLDELNRKQAYIWSSVTLYSKDVREWRQKLFEEWLAGRSEFDQASIMAFHRFGTNGDSHNGFVMNRSEQVKTLCISSVSHGVERSVFKHLDLIDSSKSTRITVVQKDLIGYPD